MRQHQRRHRRGVPAAVGLADDGAQGVPADPVAAALVAEHVAPAAGAGRLVAGVAAIGDRAGAGDHHDARLVPDRGDQRDQRVVGDQRPRLVADAPHHAMHHLPVVGAIDAGHPQGDGRRRRQAIADDAVHHRVQDLLDLELPRRLQVGAAGARLVEDAAFEVGEQAHRLGAACVETDHVRRVSVGAHGSGATIQSERCVSGRRPDEPEWAPCSRSSCSAPRPESTPPPPRSAAPSPRRPRRSAARRFARCGSCADR